MFGSICTYAELLNASHEQIYGITTLKNGVTDTVISVNDILNVSYSPYGISGLGGKVTIPFTQNCSAKVDKTEYEVDQYNATRKIRIKMVRNNNEGIGYYYNGHTARVVGEKIYFSYSSVSEF